MTSTHQDIENIVKGLIRESVSSKLTDADIRERGINKFDVIESYLTDIMAIGYNNYSKELTINDIFELQSQMSWVTVNKIDIEKRVIQTMTKFKTEIDGFITMVKSIASGEEKSTVLDKVKQTLEKN